MSHMEIGVRELRNRTSRVIDAVKAGERVTLTVNGEPTADIVPHGQRTRWLSGSQVRDQLRDRAADPALRHELDDLAGQTLGEL
jgi:prevent-host-death family protein